MGNIALGVGTGSMDQRTEISGISSSIITTKRNHGFCAGDSVAILGEDDAMAECGFTLAAGSKTSSRNYYVIASSLTDTTFKLSETLGGPAITIGAVSDPPFVGDVIPSQLRIDTGVVLSATLAAGATSMTVANNLALPVAPFVAYIDGPATGDTEQGEFVLVTANPRDGNPASALTIVRGFEGSKDVLHTANALRKVYARSLAPSATAMADFDALEALLRATSAINRPTNDAYNGRANTLLRFTASTTTITTVDSGGSATAHGMVQGDRFVIVARSGTPGQGENVRLGHAYYVKSAPTTSTLTFCAERLHSSENPYHASATETAAIDVGTAITGTGSYAFLRKLTSGGGTTRLLSVSDSFYPRLWGWGTNIGQFRDRGVLSATLHLRAVIDRAAQNIINHTTMCNPWDPASIKHTYHTLTFKNVVGTFKITVDDVQTAAITYTSAATLADRIYAALSTSSFSFLSNLRVQMIQPKRIKNKAGAVTHTYPRCKVSFNGSRKGLYIHPATGVPTVGGDVVPSAPSFLLKPSQRAQVAERWARQGAQIALVSPELVFFRMNFEFEAKFHAWTSQPETTRFLSNGGVFYATDGQQQAYDCWGDDSNTKPGPWKAQWTTMRTALVTTGGASNARTVWCAHTAEPVSSIASSYPGDAAVDYTGWDYYVDYPPESQSTGKKNTYDRLSKNVAALRVKATKPIIICEHAFGAKASTKNNARNLQLPDLNESYVFDSTVDAGGNGDAEPNGAQAPGNATRAPNFKWWIQRIYSNHANIVGAVYWDRDLGGANDWRLQSGNSLISAFAEELLKPKTRTKIS